MDPAARTVLFRGVGMEPGRNPYYQHFYRASLDGGTPVLLTPEDAHHTVTMAASGRFFVDSYSTPTTPPVTVVRDTEGRVVVPLEEADITALVAHGWKAPIPFTVKARDGQTDLYGLMYTPTTMAGPRSTTGRPAGTGSGGFRCTGRKADLRSEVAKPAADPGRGQPVGRAWAFPGSAQVIGQAAGQA